MGNFQVTSEKMPPSPKEQRLRRVRFLQFALLSVLVVVLAGFVIRVNQYVVADGYVTSEQYAEIRPPVAGKVEKIFAQSGARVNQGDMLFKLDTSEEQAVLDEAKSRMQKAEDDLTHREAEIVEEKRRLAEDIVVASLRLSNVVNRLERARELYERKFVTAAALEEDYLKVELARAELASFTNRDLTVYEKQLAVLRQELEARQDAAQRAEVGVRAREIRSPIAGQVLRYDFVVGEQVRPEMVLFEVFGGDRLILKLRIPERHATRVAAGNRYSAALNPYRRITDAYFTGTVERLRNVIQTEGQQNYRVAFCSFDAADHKVPPGTTAEARIYYGKTCLWFFLLGMH